MDIEDVIAREAIRYTLSLYNNAGDHGRIEDVVSCFTKDGVLETGVRTCHGRDEMRAFFGSVREAKHGGQSLAGSRHELSTSLIELGAPGEAKAWTYFTVTRQGRIIQTGRYADTLVRDGERWRFAHRRVRLTFEFFDGVGSSDPVEADAQPNR